MLQTGMIIGLSLLTGCSGFLLDDRTQPQTTTSRTFSDQHFNMLFNILADEKRSRLKIEERVIKLENELLATQKGVTSNYHTGTKNNETIGQQMGTVNALDAKYMSLQSKYDSLNSKFEQLKLNHTSLEKFAYQLQQKLASLDDRNETNHYIALLRKANSTEYALEHAKLLINNSLAKFQNQTLLQIGNISSSLEHKFILMDAKQNMSQLQLNKLNSTIEILQYNQNITSTNLTEELRKTSNRGR